MSIEDRDSYRDNAPGRMEKNIRKHHRRRKRRRLIMLIALLIAAAAVLYGLSMRPFRDCKDIAAKKLSEIWTLLTKEIDDPYARKDDTAEDEVLTEEGADGETETSEEDHAALSEASIDDGSADIEAGSGDEGRTDEETEAFCTTVYSNLCDQLIDLKTEVTFETDSEGNRDVLGEQYVKVLEDHPEIFWLTGNGQWSIETSPEAARYTFTPDMNTDIAKVPEMEEKLESAINEILAGTSDLTNDLDKALYVHDAIIERCEYDKAAYENRPRAGSGGGRTLPYTAYGCLVNRTAVCEGYAYSYKLLMDRLGIPCRVISGTATNSVGTGDHAWNEIEINGDIYYVDVTWDDPVGAPADGEISRQYFALSREEISRDHMQD